MNLLLRIEKQPALRYLANKKVRFPRVASDILEVLYQAFNKRATLQQVFKTGKFPHEIEETTIAWTSLVERGLLLPTGRVVDYEKEVTFNLTLLSSLNVTVRQRKGMYFSGVPFRVAITLFQVDRHGVGVDGRDLATHPALINVRTTTYTTSIQRLRKEGLITTKDIKYDNGVRGIRIFWTDSLLQLLEGAGFAPNDVNMIRASLKAKLDLIINNATQTEGYRVAISQEEARFLKTQIQQLESSF